MENGFIIYWSKNIIMSTELDIVIEKELVLIRLNPDYLTCLRCKKIFSISKSHDFCLKRFLRNVNYRDPQESFCVLCAFPNSCLTKIREAVDCKPLLKIITELYAPIYKTSFDNNLTITFEYKKRI